MPLSEGLDVETRSEFQKILTGNKSKLHKLLILIISLVLFAMLSNIWFSWYGIVLIIIVLMIHELGHFIGMKKFGYKDPYIFFIPFIGAAVSGNETAPKGSHRAIISLLGPVPGIALGVLFGIFYLIFHKFTFLGISGILLLVNGSNLLPFLPFDGGRFFDAILFARHRALEMVFKTVPGIVFLGIAIYLNEWWLGVFSILILIFLPAQFKIISIAHEIRSASPVADWKSSDDIVNNIISRLKDRFIIRKPKQFAKLAHIVWQKINFEPPNMKETMILFSIYVISLSAMVLSLYFSFSKAYVKKIEPFKRENGIIVSRELTYFSDYLSSSYEVSENNLYHGKAIHYILDRVKWEGQYYQGKIDGEWTHYDLSGKADNIIYFDKGRFIIQKKLIRTGWKELTWADLSERDKMNYLKKEQGRPLGPTTGLAKTSK